MNKKFGIREVVAIGIGTALFVVLTEIQIPIGIPNTYLQPRMAVMAFLAAVYGPVLDILIYAEPANKVFIQGAFAFLGNIIIIGVLGTLLLLAYSRVAGKSGSLTEEE